MSSITPRDAQGRTIKRGSNVKPTSYKVRYRTPGGKSRSKTFRRKVDADDFLISVENSKRTGEYVDRNEGRMTL